MKITEKGCQLLSGAIIRQAVVDYIDCLTDWNMNPKINTTECENFFRSDWFLMLSDTDGEQIINNCKMIASKMEKLLFDFKKVSKKVWVVFKTDSPDVIISTFSTREEASADAAERQGIPIKYFNRIRLQAKKAGGSYRTRKEL